MPSPVDKYVRQVKEKNPSYSDAQAWATGWSIFCKHVEPGHSSCSKPPSEYLKGKQARWTTSPDDHVVESAYFHVGNGGLTLRVVRSMSPDRREDGYQSYRMDYHFSHMGTGVDGSFDMQSPEIVAWMIGALTRALPRMREDLADAWDPYNGDGADIQRMNGVSVDPPPKVYQTDSQASALRVASRFYRPSR